MKSKEMETGWSNSQEWIKWLEKGCFANNDDDNNNNNNNNNNNV
jgi:hypothetical protein